MNQVIKKTVTVLLIIVIILFLVIPFFNLDTDTTNCVNLLISVLCFIGIGLIGVYQ